MPRLRRSVCSGPGLTRVAPRARLLVCRGGRDADRGSRGDRADPRARDPAGVEGRLDLPPGQRAHPGDRDRRRRAQAVPLPPEVARAPRPREVRRDARLRRRAAEAAPQRRRRPRPPRAGARPRCSPAPRACSTSGSFASAASATRTRTRPSGSRRCARATCGSSAARRPSTTRPRAAKRHRRTIEDELVLPTLRALKKRNGGGSESCSPTTGAQRLGRRQVERHQRVPEAGLGRRLQRQGLPDLERDGARRGRGGERRRAGGDEGRAQAGGQRRRQAGGGLSRQHPRRLPQLPTSTHGYSIASRTGRRSSARCNASSPDRVRTSSRTARRSRRRSAG